MPSAVDRIYELLMRPGDAWLDIKEESTTAAHLYLRYAVPLAIIPAAARMVGMTVIGISFLGVRYRSPFLNALGYSIISYVLSLAALYVAAKIVKVLAPYFGGRSNFDQALKLVVYSSIPYWLGGVFLVIPGLSPLATLISLYGYYLLYRGISVLMNVARSRVPLYFLALLAVGAVLAFVISSIATALFLEGRMGMR